MMKSKCQCKLKAGSLNAKWPCQFSPSTPKRKSKSQNMGSRYKNLGNKMKLKSTHSDHFSHSIQLSYTWKALAHTRQEHPRGKITCFLILIWFKDYLYGFRKTNNWKENTKLRHMIICLTLWWAQVPELHSWKFLCWVGMPQLSIWKEGWVERSGGILQFGAKNECMRLRCYIITS